MNTPGQKFSYTWVGSRMRAMRWIRGVCGEITFGCKTATTGPVSIGDSWRGSRRWGQANSTAKWAASRCGRLERTRRLLAAQRRNVGGSAMSPSLVLGCLGAYLLASQRMSQAFALASALVIFAVVHLAGGY